MTRIAVIDIGKTNAKLALVDLESLSEIAVITRPNRVLPGPPYPHFDVEGHWQFLCDGLRRFQDDHGVDAISITTHGACAALLGADGDLAAPILDYEFAGPEDTAAAYDAIRPDFAETGAARLAGGLNIGAQLHWQFARDPSLLERTQTIVTYPQYWAWRLTGVAATDVTSLGCHTDLWNPYEGRFSSLVDRLGIADKIAPARKSSDVLGPVRAEVAARTGLAPETPVYCGIHDSNASLLPHILNHTPPFTVISTGTWTVAMAVGGDQVALDPQRDVLVNVNAFGDPVPSARFMGGREHDLATGGPYPAPTMAEQDAVLREGVMLLPAVVSDSGPFRGHRARWIGDEPEIGSARRGAAVAFYLALVSAQCLALIGHRGPIIVEGPFARNDAYQRMLAAATGCEVRPQNSATGTSQGAALLAVSDRPAAMHRASDPSQPPAEATAKLRAYAAAWARRCV